jgi:ABC-type thiamin/hydroxymethylpyrimidine transport system permease subunit
MRALFGGTIAVVLLAIYVRLVWVGYQLVSCATGGECDPRAPRDLNEGMAQALTVIGGLVSALVIAELAITQPGDAPAGRVLAADASERAKTILKFVTATYVVVWLITGLVAFLVGLNHPKVLPPFTSVGQSWLGLAVASSYAYFGLNRK